MLNPDRKYSLTTTEPKDYEPEAIPDGLTLTELADLYKTDKGTIKHNYTKVYEKYLDLYAGHIENLLEIGVACGASLKMWSRYLPEAMITGLDIRPQCKDLCRGYGNIEIVIADATKWLPEKNYQVIIDDGSHVSEHIVTTFNNLWKHVDPGGFYIIEDMKCTHSEGYAKSFEFHVEPHAFWRRHVTNWLDKLMRDMDNKQSDIEYIHYTRELMVIKKHG